SSVASSLPPRSSTKSANALASGEVVAAGRITPVVSRMVLLVISATPSGTSVSVSATAHRARTKAASSTSFSMRSVVIPAPSSVAFRRTPGRAPVLPGFAHRSICARGARYGPVPWPPVSVAGSREDIERKATYGSYKTCRLQALGSSWTVPGYRYADKGRRGISPNNRTGTPHDSRGRRRPLAVHEYLTAAINQHKRRSITTSPPLSGKGTP